MEVFIIAVAFVASILTFFSGFGLGTILLPAFSLFFDLTTSVLLTAIVHFLNNVLKFFLVRKNIDISILIKFGTLSLLAALAGAWCLKQIDSEYVLYSYSIGERLLNITLSGVIVGMMIFVFSLWEVLPYFKNISFGKDKLALGGILSGFFGGLTGHQGALRSAFLIKLGLSKEAFIGTGVAIACIVDIGRMTVYSTSFSSELISANYKLLLGAVLSAWAGAIIGNKLFKKMTIEGIKWFVTVFMMLIAFCIISGVLNK